MFDRRTTFGRYATIFVGMIILAIVCRLAEWICKWWAETSVATIAVIVGSYSLKQAKKEQRIRHAREKERDENDAKWWADNARGI